MLPALSAPDIFVQQAAHLFKHMCSEHTRAFWVLEFWRHVIARRNDVAFWRSVRLIAASEPQAEIAIGAATLLASLIFGPFAPAELTSWSMDRLPPGICLWIQLYGRHILLSDSPRSKLYLLLREQLVPISGCESSAEEADLPDSSAATRHTRGSGRINLFPSQSLSRTGEVRAYPALVSPRRRVAVRNRISALATTPHGCYAMKVLSSTWYQSVSRTLRDSYFHMPSSDSLACERFDCTDPARPASHIARRKC